MAAAPRARCNVTDAEITIIRAAMHLYNTDYDRIVRYVRQPDRLRDSGLPLNVINMYQTGMAKPLRRRVRNIVMKRLTE